MGVTIQFESHQVELAGIHEMEHDTAVLEYFDQPPPIRLDYQSSSGKRMGVFHTPDFFVIKPQQAGWEEWKTEEELHRLSAHNALRYCVDANGQWCCPPGSAFAERLGLYYRVRSSSEIDWIFQRNIQFLEDYLRDDSPGIPATGHEHAIAQVSAAPGLSLKELLELTAASIAPDTIFAMIAAGVLHVNLHAAPLAEPEQVEVFASPEASRSDIHRSPSTQLHYRQRPFQCGSQIIWDGRSLNVANIGETHVSLISEQHDLVELPVATFETLVRDNRLEFTTDDSRHISAVTIRDRLARANEAALRAATHRSGLIGQYIDRGILPHSTEVPPRTFFRWLARYREAESAYGNGFVGLLPTSGNRGNRRAKLPELSRTMMQEHIGDDYETLKQKTRYSSWIQLKLACEERGVSTPSYKTFCRAVLKRPAHEQTLKRKGRRASYQVETFHWDLTLKTPRHGDRPFEVVHIDHTELDVECVTGSGQVLGRPWLTLLTDAFSRRVLAFYLTFDPPSYRSCMMVLRECVRRFNRIPQILIVDGGREFASTYFETLLARYECTKKTRPPAKARFGSICERMFGAANSRFIHNLRGNTQITRNVRQVTKSVDPKGLATWSLTELHRRLSEYLYEVHDTIKHPALGCSPREAYDAAIISGGSRARRMVAYNEEFLMMTLPTTAKGAAKVTPSRGVKINHIYYWCEAFRQMVDELIPVRYDPFDAGLAYAFVGKQWRRCHSECYGTLNGRSEREIMLATTELRRQRHNHSRHFSVTARRMAEFLQSVEAEEHVLAQRLRDQESSTTRLGIITAATSSGVIIEQQGPQLSPNHVGMADELVIGELYGEF
jgi:transposase InsO family protein